MAISATNRVAWQSIDYARKWHTAWQWRRMLHTTGSSSSNGLHLAPAAFAMYTCAPKDDHHLHPCLACTSSGAAIIQRWWNKRIT